MTTRGELKARIEALITAFEASQRVEPAARDELIEDLAAWQAERIPEYGRLQRHGAWPPALPTDVFRFRRTRRRTTSACS
ncbi:MAG: hypothetical protein JRE82_06530 [Deltaproteobacteria bacterium]|nr:hypothetical protein [Deltaproteobacteria bacterium]